MCMSRHHVTRVAHAVLDFFFPRSVRATRVQHTHVRYAPRRVTRGSLPVYTLTSYRARGAQDAITAAKFEKDAVARRKLAALVDTFLDTHAPGASIILVPVPLSRTRLRQRGYNQVVEVLAETRAVQDARAKIETACLSRVRDTPPQTTCTRYERRTNMHGAFTADAAGCTGFEGATVFLVDDVVTTGATLQAAYAALFPHTRCTTLAFARA